MEVMGVDYHLGLVIKTHRMSSHSLAMHVHRLEMYVHCSTH